MSSKKFRTTYILIAIFIILFLFVYFFEKDRVIKEEGEIETYQVAQLDQSEFKQIKISYEDQNTVLEKDGEDWKITKPIKYQARKQKIDDIFSEINSIEAEQKFTADQLSDYGLDNPTTKLIFTKNTNEKIEVLLGDLNPEQTKIYFKTSLSNEIYLVDSTIETRLRLNDEVLKED